VNSRFWTLAKRPPPLWPDDATFALGEAPIPTPGLGQALTRTLYVSLDPYQWGRKRRGEEPEGRALPRPNGVAGRRKPDRRSGNRGFRVQHEWLGRVWPYGGRRPSAGLHGSRKLDPTRGKISHAVGVLGMLGLTAYAGMVLQCEPKPGETIVVSAASGGVGQIAGQLGRLKGCRVVGIAGREEKCRYVEEALGFAACISHLSPTFPQDLKAACPQRHRCLFRECRWGDFRRGAASVQPGREDDDLRVDRALRRCSWGRHPSPGAPPSRSARGAGAEPFCRRIRSGMARRLPG